MNITTRTIMRDRFPNDNTMDGKYGLCRTLEGHQLAVRRIIRALKPLAQDFDALYVTGLSGTIPAATAALVLKKQLLVLRKVDPHGSTLSHGQTLEGDVQWSKEIARYIIVDDFISSGETIRRLMKHKPSGPGHFITGIMLWGQPRMKYEKTQGYLREFTTTTEGGLNPEQTTWRVVRRHPTSMMFDLVSHDCQAVEKE